MGMFDIEYTLLVLDQTVFRMGRRLYSLVTGKLIVLHINPPVHHIVTDYYSTLIFYATYIINIKLYSVICI
jgi:hypothetical protein